MKKYSVRVPGNICRGDVVMKTVVTTLAIIAFLATSALAKTERTKISAPQSRSSITRIFAIRLTDFYCYGQTDPDPRVRLQLLRDCRYWEDD
jgi:hypothetical protein